MFHKQRSELLAKYQDLSAISREVLQLMAVAYNYEMATPISQYLKVLKINDARGRQFTPASIKPILLTLVKAGFLEQQTGKAEYRCHRLLAEPIVRQLVETGEFERYVAPFEQSTTIAKRTYYGYSSECLRDARISFHRGDYKQVNATLNTGRRYSYQSRYPDDVDIYFTWVLNPFDEDWLERRHPALVKELIGHLGMHQLVFLYHDPQISDYLARWLALYPGASPLAARAYGELLLLRGDWNALAKHIEATEDPELLALGAALTFLHGDFAGSTAQFESALKAFRKLTGKRNLYFYGVAGLFYPLALLKTGDAHDKKLTALMTQILKQNNIWYYGYRYLEALQVFLKGDLTQRDNAVFYNLFVKTEGYSKAGEPQAASGYPHFLKFFLLLVRSWMSDAPLSGLRDLTITTIQDMHRQLHANGLHWLAAELAKLLQTFGAKSSDSLDTGFPDGRPVTLHDLFARRPDWEFALDALLGLGKSEAQTGAPVQIEKPTRMIWLVDFDEKYGVLNVEPREQKQQAKGGWTKGRAVALKKLYAERDTFDCLSEQDLKLCATIRQDTDSGWYGGAYFEFSGKMPLALVGHPLLFWASSPEVRVDVVKGEPELRVSTVKGGKIKITLEPEPISMKNVLVTKETPTRLKVVQFTQEHHKIYTVLGAQGLEVPLSAQERVLQTLSGISGLLTVHSDIGGSSSTAEQVEADSTPRMHLLPHGDGLKAALLIRPFATGGAYYQAGQGGASVFAEIDGKPLQARRDLKLEKARCEDVLAACPALAEAERDDAGEWLLDDPEQCLELLLQLQSLPAGQVLLEWPEGVKFRVLGQSSGSGFSMQIKRDNDWFALQGELQVNNDTVLEMRQLLDLLDNRQGRFLQLQDGQFIALTETFRKRLEDLKAYADLTGKKVRINPLAALTLEDWQDEAGFKADQHWQEHMRRLKAAREFQPVVPSTFQAELRDYQMDGYNWLARLAQWGVGACLADDMGLGKTIQALALLVDKAPNGPSLIIAPTSVCMNWESEARRFAPTLNPILFGSGDRQRKLDNLGPYDLLICSYGLLQQEQAAEMLSKIPFQITILDEAQAIKNIATRRSQGAMNLQAEFRVIMTGTPLENHLGELWNLFRFINPGLLGSLEQFNKRFAGPIERDRSQEARQQLKKLIQPFILRRTKTQVLQELPPKTEIPVYVEMSGEEMAFYEALRRESLEVLNSTDSQAGAKHLQILAAITKLRRSCCNTRLANADISLPSSKLAAFGEIVDELLDNKHKALVFSQFVDHLQLIKDYIEQRGIGYQYLDGSTQAKERKKRVDAFQRGEGELFLISLKAGGVGLNLTAADYVIHMDPWWNPAVEDQASDRAHRMGQQRPVTIYRMIAKNTIEEKIVALHSHKRDLADSLLEGADISGKMSADDLLDLMRGE
ncbi:MAG: ATP-dependent helicase [Gammaproteobacteria bacterium HGW-Gammaproteobacteria-10]|nr:MAG: ATP-dependent helicase [Gammaproteobacteria bacterium HGW-Gammaproteobacteria-10]